MRLPLETVFDVVNALAVPAHPLQYGYDDQTLDALVNLCQLNHALHEFTLPHLYRSINVLTVYQFIYLHKLFLTKPQRARHVTSICFGPYAEDVELSQENLHRLADIITAIQPSIRRICLDRDFRLYRPDDDLPHGKRALIRRALEGCHFLEEFSSIRCELYLTDEELNPDPVCWPNWRNLQRLALYNVDVSAKITRLISELPCLTHLIFCNPDWNDSDGDNILLPLNTEEGSLRRLIFAYRVGNWSRLWQRSELFGRVKAMGPPKRASLEILEVEVQEDDEDGESYDFQDYIRDQVLGGSVWDELEGINVVSQVTVAQALDTD
ncbi:hypothetical protein AX16_007659 [Volvariella volvacea WC 439]|nr:hypothetical protein AX16_007659 [Volvariella volvacea WC 439]